MIGPDKETTVLHSSPVKSASFVAGLSPAATVAVIGAVLGILAYGLLTFGIWPRHDFPLFGTDIYDRYYLSLLDGRFDLPATVLRYEGHYAPDGTGYLYHGVAPLLTRFVFGWLVPLDRVSLAPFSVWFWACLGSLFYHKLFHDLTIRFRPQGAANRYWPLLLAALVWVATPGLLIAVNPALFHEPIAVGYAASAGLLYAFARWRFLGGSWVVAIIAMAAWAALSLHARPNLAIGLYAATMLMCLGMLLEHRRQALFSIVMALSILGASGLGYLALNKLKFGSVGATHGSFSESGVQYGPVFWGLEDEDSERARAFARHGKFNIRRVPSNLAVYALDPPPAFGETPIRMMNALHEKAMASGLGFIRIENPRIGFVYLWLPWLVMIVVAIGMRRFWQGMISVIPVLAGTAISAALTLSYATIALRYRFDLWPFIAALAVMACPVIVPRLAAWLADGRRIVAILVLVFSINMSLVTAVSYSQSFREEPSGFFAPWSIETCRERAMAKGLPAERIDAVCMK